MRSIGDGKQVGRGGQLPLGARLVPAFSDHASLLNRTEAQAQSEFLQWFASRRVNDWDGFYKHLWWEFTHFGQAGSPTKFGPYKFDTLNGLISYLVANDPNGMPAGRFSDGVYFNCYEAEDPSDPFPSVRRVRNSITASIKGRSRWLGRNLNDCSGVSNQFNDPQYYVGAFPGNVGRFFIQLATGVLPPSNNDGCVWHTRRKHSLWSFPEIGGMIDVRPDTRGAAWDSVGSTWVSPAPAGGYELQDPFVLMERNRSQVLETYDPGSSSNLSKYVYPLVHSCAMVFPCVMSSRYWAAAMYPFGFDTFYTDPLGSDHELVLRMNYRRHRIPKYRVVPASSADLNVEMFKTCPPFSTSYIYNPNRLPGNIDSTLIPTEVHLCRRHTETGVRSRWTLLARITRRAPNAPLRLDPAYKWRVS